MDTDTAEHTFGNMKLQGRVLWTPMGLEVLSAKVSAMLAFLMDHPDQVYTSEQLCYEVLGPYYGQPSSTGTYYLKKLKKLLEEDLEQPECIRRFRVGPNGGWVMTTNEELSAKIDEMREKGGQTCRQE